MQLIVLGKFLIVALLTIHLSSDDPWKSDSKHIFLGSRSGHTGVTTFWNKVNLHIGGLFRPMLDSLLNSGKYDATSELHRKVLAYIFVPVIQRELDLLMDQHNTNCIRKQKGARLPTGGRPEYFFRCPESFGGKFEGRVIDKETLSITSEEFSSLTTSNVVKVEDDLLETIKMFVPDIDLVPSLQAGHKFNEIIQYIKIAGTAGVKEEPAQGSQGHSLILPPNSKIL